MIDRASRPYDVILFGATGFTGGLVAHYLARHPTRATLRWALAGRNRAKLEAVRADLAKAASELAVLPILIGDAQDATAMATIARQAHVVCTTTGPYAKYGSELVAACADAGTAYCDLTGEVPWMRRMIDAHHDRAAQTGARIVHTCGFDSIPSDLGTWALQQEMIARFGAPATSVTAYYGESKGGASGGTIASMLTMAEELERDPGLRRLLANPYALDPATTVERPRVPDVWSLGYDRRLGKLTAPFFMAAVNTRVVRRAHALAGFPWGEGFRYQELMSAPRSARGLALAATMTAGLGGMLLAMANRPLRELLARRLPQPGEGPDQRARDAGYFTVRLVGEIEGRPDARLMYQVSDHADPGYGSTSKMLGEAALCLAFDDLPRCGGCLTPSLAMGGKLVERLRTAGLTFAVTDS
jgi:short subunit dehydrogenase-like uncharacterized protein